MHRVPKSNFGHLFFTSQLVIARWHAHATQGLKKHGCEPCVTAEDYCTMAENT